MCISFVVNRWLIYKSHTEIVPPVNAPFVEIGIGISYYATGVPPPFHVTSEKLYVPFVFYTIG